LNFQIFQALDHHEVAQLTASCSRMVFTDGKATAFGAARAVKNNLQSEPGGPEPDESRRMVLAALSHSSDFQSFALPNRLVIPTFARYTPGMEYGWHLDSAIAGAGAPLRSDLACTVFLSEPDTYDGGELVLDLATGEQEIKLSAGEAVVYPATTVHRVAKVTRGVRLVAITWIQSLVRDERIRGILYDLMRAHQIAEQRNETEAAMLINKSYQNMLRIAAEL
jgi:PKHD-type hydroxylase